MRRTRPPQHRDGRDDALAERRLLFLGNPVEFTIRELAELVIELTGARSNLGQHPLPSDDPTQRRPDISLARAELGWEPKIKLREGLEMTIAYFRALGN